MRLQELVSGWMTDRPVTVGPDRPVIEAFALMAENEIRHLPVVEGGAVVGIVSDRDLHRAAARHGVLKPGEATHLFKILVQEIMTRGPIVSVEPMTTLAEAARLLLQTKISSLPVLDGRKLVGIVTTHDLLRALTTK